MKIFNGEFILLKVWLALIFLTSISVLIAETPDFGTASGIFVCFVVMLKSHLVIDRFIGLRSAHPRIRKVMLSYFYIIPSLIVFGLVFPDVVVKLTSLR